MFFGSAPQYAWCVLPLLLLLLHLTCCWAAELSAEQPELAKEAEAAAITIHTCAAAAAANVLGPAGSAEQAELATKQAEAAAKEYINARALRRSVVTLVAAAPSSSSSSSAAAAALMCRAVS
jgi:hypothetical protein